MEPHVNMARLLAPDVAQAIDEGNTAEVREVLLQLFDADLAEVLMALSPEQRAAAFQLLPRERAAAVFPFFSEPQQQKLVNELGAGQLADLLNEMNPDDRTEFFEGLSERVVPELLAILEPAERQEARNLLQYPPESVGRLVTTDYLTVRPEWTVQQVLNHIRLAGREAETLDTLYVVDAAGRLIDDVPLRDVLLADPGRRTESLIDGQVVTLKADDDREQAVRTMEHYDRPVIPVVDDRQEMVGVVTFDDVADVAEEEATEDFHLAAAVAPLAVAYDQASVWSLYHRRIGWLVILVFVNLVSSGIIAAYEDVLEATIALAFFLPLLIDSGGNTGSQAATLVIRALATGEIRLRQWLTTMLKEIGVGLALGLTMALASLGLGAFRGGYEVGLVVAISMACIVVTTNLVGVLLPFLLSRLKIDPAVASSPLITTVADAMGLLIYFTVATSLLGPISPGNGG